MSFSEKLNNYMEEYKLTSAQLTTVTGLSKSTISRFKNGKQEPSANSDTLKRLAKGIAELTGCRESDIHNAFAGELKSNRNFEQIASNLNELITAFDINANDLSRFLNYDASYLSRIRSSQRRPANVNEFCEGVATFVANHYGDNVSILTMLLDCNENDIKTNTALKKAVHEWLCESIPRQEHSVNHFLQEVDNFDLNEFIRDIHFDKIKTPTLPFSISGAKTYFTVSGFMKAELDWIKTTVLSSSEQSIIMYSDMPMEEMAKDPKFPKKIIAGMAMMLKKGLHLDMIHNIDRSFNEMMLGLEGWIPLYMTGQVSPYYFKGKRDNVFHHFIRVSGAAALTGEAIVGKHENGKYYLTRNKDEIAYYRRRAEDMLSKADSLMDIYNEDSADEFMQFIENDFHGKGCLYRNILSTPPLYTISVELLTKILDTNNVGGKLREDIFACFARQCELLKKDLEASSVNDEVLMLSEAEFKAYPSALELTDILTCAKIYYTYDTYCEHIAQTKKFVKTHRNYQCAVTKGQAFRNIQIRIAQGKYAIISKNMSPTIHFVIRHPKLRNAIENMIVPIQE